jgi:hypothetical protein
VGTVPTLGSHKTDLIQGQAVEKVDLHQGLNFFVRYGPASRTKNQKAHNASCGLFLFLVVPNNLVLGWLQALFL